MGVLEWWFENKKQLVTFKVTTWLIHSYMDVLEWWFENKKQLVPYTEQRVFTSSLFGFEPYVTKEKIALMGNLTCFTFAILFWHIFPNCNIFRFIEKMVDNIWYKFVLR